MPGLALNRRARLDFLGIRVETFGLAEAHLDTLGPTRTHLGPFRCTLDSLGLAWAHSNILDSLGLAGTHFGLTWARLDSLRTWFHLVLLGFTWFHLV